jgi:hypothetical protein
VPAGVGQGLLQDAVHGEPNPGGRDGATPTDLDVEVEPGRARLLEQGGHVVEPAPAVHRLVAEQVHQPLELRLRVGHGTLGGVEGDGGAAGSRSSCSRAAPAWTVATLTLWATMSCSSRAMRVRSSLAAMRSEISRSRSTSSASTANRSASVRRGDGRSRRPPCR